MTQTLNFAAAIAAGGVWLLLALCSTGLLPSVDATVAANGKVGAKKGSGAASTANSTGGVWATYGGNDGRTGLVDEQLPGDPLPIPKQMWNYSGVSSYGSVVANGFVYAAVCLPAYDGEPQNWGILTCLPEQGECGTMSLPLSCSCIMCGGPNWQVPRRASNPTYDPVSQFLVFQLFTGKHSHICGMQLGSDPINYWCSESTGSYDYSRSSLYGPVVIDGLVYTGASGLALLYPTLVLNVSNGWIVQKQSAVLNGSQYGNPSATVLRTGNRSNGNSSSSSGTTLVWMDSQADLGIVGAVRNHTSHNTSNRNSPNGKKKTLYSSSSSSSSASSPYYYDAFSWFIPSMWGGLGPVVAVPPTPTLSPPNNTDTTDDERKGGGGVILVPAYGAWEVADGSQPKPLWGEKWKHADRSCFDGHQNFQQPTCRPATDGHVMWVSTPMLGLQEINISTGEVIANFSGGANATGQPIVLQSHIITMYFDSNWPQLTEGVLIFDRKTRKVVGSVEIPNVTGSLAYADGHLFVTTSYFEKREPAPQGFNLLAYRLYSH